MTPTILSDQPRPNSAKGRSPARVLLLSAIATTIFYGLATRLSYLPPPQLLAATLCLPHCPETSPETSPIHKSPDSAAEPPDSAAEPQPQHSAKLAELLPSDYDKADISILIEKSKHRLTVYHQLKPTKSYAVVFGEAPVGDKRFEGDRKTPEGILRVRDLYPHPHWSKFIWLDYPNAASWRKHLIAKVRGQVPWTATIGSEIGIHGVPGNGDMIDNRINWTWGCPSLKNEDVDEIYQVLQVGTIVEIQP